MNRSVEELLKIVLGDFDEDEEMKAEGHHGPICDGGRIHGGCGVDSDLLCFLAWRELKAIRCLLKHPRFGLKEIKREIKDIEDNMNGDGDLVGPQSTGPIFVRTG